MIWPPCSLARAISSGCRNSIPALKTISFFPAAKTGTAISASTAGGAHSTTMSASAARASIVRIGASHPISFRKASARPRSRTTAPANTALGIAPSCRFRATVLPIEPSPTMPTLIWGPSCRGQGFLLGRRRKGAIQLREVARIQTHGQRAMVLAHMRLAAGLRDDHHAVLLQQPGERDLRGIRAVPRRHGFQLARAQQAPLVERRIGHDGNPAPLTPRDQIELDPPLAQIVHHLIGCDVFSVGKFDNLLHLANVEIADAPMADLSGPLQCGEGIHSFGDRTRSGPVQQIKIDAVGLQTLQALLARRYRAAPRGVSVHHLADEKGFVAAARARFAPELFGAPARTPFRWAHT